MFLSVPQTAQHVESCVDISGVSVSQGSHLEYAKPNLLQ